MNEAFKIHLLPGLGFDHRIFRKLKLPSENISPLNWQEPRHLEHIEDYAFRVSDNLENTNKKNILIGHSFGGIMAQEISNIRPVEKIILLSSIRSRDELPSFFRMVDWFGLHPIFSKKSTFSTFRFWAKKHGYDTNEKQKLFKEMVARQSNNYLRWALKNLSAWQGAKNSETPIFQIHGDQDRTFPIHYLKNPDHVVNGGSHLMVYDRPEEISQLIFQEINNVLKEIGEK